MSTTKGRRAVAVVVSVAMLLGVVGGGIWAVMSLLPPEPQIVPHCEATVGEYTVSITTEQAYNAGIIAGVSVKRGLIPRAASIALATAYQESKILNLDYGHADSLGLFQQRTSQGWGTEEEIMDPWYSSARFYKELVKFKGWETGDINDYAQKVQRSGYPEAYRQHESNARTLASALTGETPAAFTCILPAAEANDIAGMTDYLKKTFGKKITLEQTDDLTLTITTDDQAKAWSAAAVAISAADTYGLATAAVGTHTWTRAADPAWTSGEPTTTVTLAFAKAG
ncbi:MAG: hypothetical protein LBR20_00020 [Propionibacteriaceae bacterium]|jgi:hypothetical protein|nr:hypothetical protein [Propionibacteriaceae bacterium]